MSVYRTGVGQLVHVHDADFCYGLSYGLPCTIHNPSDHPMRRFPNRWVQTLQMMVRVCDHNEEHPDPDDMNVRMVEGRDVCSCECHCCGRRGAGSVVLHDDDA